MQAIWSSPVCQVGWNGQLLPVVQLYASTYIDVEGTGKSLCLWPQLSVKIKQCQGNILLRLKDLKFQMNSIWVRGECGKHQSWNYHN